MINNQKLAMDLITVKYGISRKELAEILCISLGLVNMWYEGIVELKQSDGERISELLGITVDEFMNLD